MDKETFFTIDLCGLEAFKNFSPKLIERTANKRMKELKVDSEEQYQELIENSTQERTVLLALLMNGFSEFFRESVAFALLENRVFPDLFNSEDTNTGIRMWSVGCSTGQEPYSILMQASNISKLFQTRKPLMMYATDISLKALDKARAGIFNRNEVGKVPFGYIDAYFEQENNAFRIVPDLKQRVDFLYYDILDQNTLCPPETIYSHFDLIICSNLLIYYDHKAQCFIIDKLIKALSPGGYLVVGEAEKALLLNRKEIKPIFKSSPIFRRNTELGKERDAI